MNENISAQLLDECIDIAIEDQMTATSAVFSQHIQELLPPEVLQVLEDIHGDASFLEDIWKERFDPALQTSLSDDADIDVDLELIEDGCCLVCERKVRLTRHHLYPREVHKSLSKKGFDSSVLNDTIAICRRCHSTIHRFWTNDELAKSYYTLDLLMADPKFYRYAEWASSQSDHSYSK